MPSPYDANGRIRTPKNSLKGRPRRAAVAAVKARGEPCWLCGGLIDLSLHWNHRMSFTVDEVIPRSLGGSTTDLSQFRSAHRACNASRGAGPPVAKPPPPARSRRYRTAPESDNAIQKGGQGQDRETCQPPRKSPHSDYSGSAIDGDGQQGALFSFTAVVAEELAAGRLDDRDLAEVLDWGPSADLPVFADELDALAAAWLSESRKRSAQDRVGRVLEVAAGRLSMARQSKNCEA